MENNYRVIVAGGRDFDDYAFMERKLDAILKHKLPNVVIIHGDCKGADRLSEKYAKLRGLQYERVPAEWDKYGDSAGPKRNEEMARDKQANACVIFWDGKSRGSRNMIAMADKYKLPKRIVRYK